MARSRNIKPAFFLNEELAEISPEGRLLFIGLWCLADREGRLEDRPKKIKAEIFPYENFDVDALLNELMSRHFIKRYCLGNAKDMPRYIQVTNFTRHQNPHPREAQSIIPPCDETVENTGSNEKALPRQDQGNAKDVPSHEKALSSRADSLLLIPDSLIYSQKDKQSEKISYAENVKMTKEQYQKLKERLNGNDIAVRKCIEILDNYKGAKGAKYKDDYRAILSWVIEKYEKEYGKPVRVVCCPEQGDDDFGVCEVIENASSPIG